jgi:hypothetical protein
MSYGFVYILANESMPGIYKIGLTDRSPALRALELSKSTSAPTSFDVVCYGEYDDAKDVERDMHDHFGARRVSDNREFFRGPIADMMDQLATGYPSRKSFCEVVYAAARYYDKR